MVVLVRGVLAKEQVLGLDVLMHNLIVMELADSIGEVGYLSYSLYDFFFGELGLDDPVEGASLDKFQLEVWVAACNASAKSLHYAFDICSADKVVDADFVTSS